jgi:hypothetical protein
VFVDFFIADTASIATLTKAIVRDLLLGVPPSRVTLTLEGETTVLDSRETLAKAGVSDRSSLIAHVAPAPPKEAFDPIGALGSGRRARRAPLGSSKLLSHPPFIRLVPSPLPIRIPRSPPVYL